MLQVWPENRQCHAQPETLENTIVSEISLLFTTHCTTFTVQQSVSNAKCKNISKIYGSDILSVSMVFMLLSANFDLIVSVCKTLYTIR